MKNTTVCSRNGCDNITPGRWTPVVNIWPVGYIKDGTDPAKLILRGLILCDAHKSQATPRDFLTEEGWNLLTDQFAKRGMSPPNRDDIELTFIDREKYNV